MAVFSTILAAVSSGVFHRWDCFSLSSVTGSVAAGVGVLPPSVLGEVLLFDGFQYKKNGALFL
jgi:hypothetical protein